MFQFLNWPSLISYPWPSLVSTIPVFFFVTQQMLISQLHHTVKYLVSWCNCWIQHCSCVETSKSCNCQVTQAFCIFEWLHIWSQFQGIIASRKDGKKKKGKLNNSWMWEAKFWEVLPLPCKINSQHTIIASKMDLKSGMLMTNLIQTHTHTYIDGPIYVYVLY